MLKQFFIFRSHFQCIILLLSFAIVHTGEANNLPDMGTSADVYLSPEDEKKLGKEFMRSVRAAFSLDYDPLNAEYVQYLGESLVSQIDTRPQQFSFFIIKDSNINAFAGPGGYIGLNSGLIIATEREDELASVVAHEIAHVVQRHLVRAFEANQKLSLPALAAIIAAVLLGQGHGDITGAVIASTMAGMTQQQLTFSRLHEQEADRVGITMMAGAGFDPQNMATFFEILEKNTRLSYGASIPEFLLTHPVTTSRIADARGRASQLSPPTFKKDQILYQLIQARVKVATFVEEKKYVHLESILARPQPTLGWRYSEILILFSKGKYKLARQKLNSLIADDRKRLPYLVTQAELELAAKDYDQAERYLRSSLQLYPNNTPLTILLAQTLIKSEQAKKAMNLLLQQIRKTNRPMGALYHLHAEAAKKAGYISEEHESLAEYFYTYGNLRTAIRQMQLALQHNSGDEYRKLRLTARLDEIKKEVLDNQPPKEDKPTEE